MKNKVLRTSIFDNRYKRFSKKFHSLKTELEQLEKELTENPMIGEPLGNGLYKIRLANEDKNKGKSAGYRVVTYLVDENKSFDIYLIIIYDKSEESSIKKTVLLKLLKQLGL
jgi:mRNA-degrading endonuclease RelE of RelBE toxin-antitoxin system